MRHNIKIRIPDQECYQFYLACHGWLWHENTNHLQHPLWVWEGPHGQIGYSIETGIKKHH